MTTFPYKNVQNESQMLCRHDMSGPLGESVSLPSQMCGVRTEWKVELSNEKERKDSSLQPCKLLSQKISVVNLFQPIVCIQIWVAALYCLFENKIGTGK